MLMRGQVRDDGRWTMDDGVSSVVCRLSSNSAASLRTGISSGSCLLSSVHGQPVRPGGGGGSSVKVGQRIIYF